MLYLYFLLYIVYLIIYRKNKTVGGVCSSVGVSPGVGGHISDGARQGGRGAKYQCGGDVLLESEVLKGCWNLWVFSDIQLFIFSSRAVKNKRALGSDVKN